MVNRKWLKIIVLSAFALLMSVGRLWAQNVTISGKVSDGADKSGTPGVTVSIVGSAVGGLTDGEGKFSISVARAPELQVKFDMPESQKDSTFTVVTTEGVDAYEVNYVVGEKEVVLGDVVFSGNRNAQNLSDLPISMTVIGPKQVDLQISHDIKDVLQQTSGVDIIDGQPSIRGSSGYAYGVGSRVMVMLDGLPMLSPEASIAQFDMIPTDNIAQIEVMKGASSVLYGSSALGGVINVIMADAPDHPKTSIRVRGQGYDSPRDKSLNWDGNKFAKSAGINVFHSQKIGRHDLTGLIDFWHDTGWKQNSATTQGRFQVLTKFRPKGINGLTWGINAMARFDSSSTFLFWDSYHPSDTLILFGGDTVFNSLGALAGGQSRRSQLNLRATIDPYIKYLTKHGGLHNYRGRFVRTSNTNNSNQSNYSTMFFNDYSYSKKLLENRLSWISGGTLIFTNVIGDSVFGGPHHAFNTALYTQFDYKISSKLNATLGGRYDRWVIDDTLVNAAPIFRAGANYEVTEGTNFRASFGQAFRSPSIAERYTRTNAGGLIVEPNPDLKVERGYSAEVGFRQGFRFGKESRSILGFLDAAAFVMNYTNMIEFGVKAPDSFVFGATPAFQARNYAHARTSGFEVSAMTQYTRDAFHIDLNGGITYMDPINLGASPDSVQVDLLHTVGPQSNPNNFASFGLVSAMNTPADSPFHRSDNPRYLKYRSKWLNRASITVGYSRFNVTCNYRYKSAILGIDQFLYIGVPGTADWVLSHPKGANLFDFIVSGQLSKAMQVSLSAKNAFNQEYAVLPGNIGEQRAYAFQVKYVF